MSLLLDALKKAAEQKAEKNKQEIAERASSDETVIDAGAEDVSGAGDDGLQPSRRALQDETEIDASEYDTRLERTRVEADDGTETRLETPDPTQTDTRPPSAQMQTGEDETIIFAEEDVADFMGEGEFDSRAQRAPEDETDLSQLAPGEDETDISRAGPAVYGDETDLSGLGPRADETDVSSVAIEAYADETDLSQQVSSEDETDASRAAPGAYGDETDISIPPKTVADLEPDAADDTDTGPTDEDMSLLLVERDQTNLTSPTSATDPQRPQDQVQALRADTGADELALVDTTRHRMPPEAAAGATTTSATATTGVNQDTQTTREATTRTEHTSTRTYAPDNYDRTLMRLPSDDASKLFAGMKSDSDVVMTPEYAKKVFRSKSSAQRMQQYKVYGGIVFAILLVIGIYGLFEFQAEQDSIDTSLRPLKRDPMPGLIRPQGENKPANLFTGAEDGVDERTISLIENADSAADAATGDGAAAAGIAEMSAVEIETETRAETGAQTAPAAATESGVIAQQAPLEAAGGAAQVEEVAKLPPDSAPAKDSGARAQTAAGAAATTEGASTAAAVDAEASSSALQISSSQRLEQKHAWLRQAFAAYQAGNDDLAFELYNKVLEVDPGNRNALLARAAIHVHNNNSRAAIRDYQKLLLANPKDSLAMVSLITVANYSPRETETQLKLMIRDDPESPYLNFALANAYGAQERWQEAQGYYFRALQNNPQDPNYAYNLAVSLEHIAQPRAAMAYYQRALDNFGNGLATFSRDVVDQRLEVLGKL